MIDIINIINIKLNDISTYFFFENRRVTSDNFS